MKRGIDILVATPGRLLDHASHRGLKLSMIEFLVFDEADRMLDMGFHEEISEVLELVPTDRRTMLFSATYTRQIRALAKIMLKEPEYIEVTSGNTIAESENSHGKSRGLYCGQYCPSICSITSRQPVK